VADVVFGTETPYAILNRVRDVRDHPAWCEFYAFCDRHFQRFGKQLRLDPHTSEEVRREAWHRLWKKMQTFEYDPGKKFRHWLWIFFRRQALDHIKKRRREREVPIDFSDEQIQDLSPVWTDRLYGSDFDGCDEGASVSPEGVRTLLKATDAVQDAVRSKVKERVWDAFRMIAIEGVEIADAAESLEMSYLATYKAFRRVQGMLTKQGRLHVGWEIQGGQAED
jgi:RNA polymerase sigma factor (sigma-70 family)